MTEMTQPASWYADPTGRHQYRYWNGTEWTDQVADNQVTSTDPPLMSTSETALAAEPAPGAPPAPAPGPNPFMAPAPGPKAPKQPGNPVWAWVSLVGAVALIVGAFLNAASASVGNGGFGISVDKSYFDGDGPLELVIGIAIAVIAILIATAVLARWGGWLIFALGIVGALIAVIDILDVKDDIDTIERLGGSGSIGPALWLCLAGGIIASVCGLLSFVTARSDAPAAG
jgi:hypothetical protein